MPPSPALVSAFLGLLLLQAIALILSLAYSRRKHRHLFSRLNALKNTLSDLRENRLVPLEEEVRKQAALREIEVRGLCRDPSTFPARFVAQFGEDLLIYEFFKGDPPSFFIEAGAYDGEFASNTLLLESLGWTGLLVEPHPRMAERCRQKRPRSVVKEAALGPADAAGTIEFTCADAPNGGAALSFLDTDPEHIERCLREGCRLTKVSVPYLPLNRLVEPLTKEVAFLSLDVEGMELAVLEGFDFQRYRPRMILVEWQGDSRDEAVQAHLGSAGYRRLAKRACNAFYLAEEEAPRFEEILRNASART